MPLKSATSIRTTDSEDKIAQKQLTSGRMPPIQLITYSLEKKISLPITKFTQYQFNGSVINPVDSFSFNMAIPSGEQPLSDSIRNGDLVSLVGNGITFCVGIIDSVEIEVTHDFGEIVAINGRDMMSQLEDNDCVNLRSNPVYGNKYTLAAALNFLIQGTRIKPKFLFQDAPKNGYLFATEPQESKLSALQRYLEPLNCIAWMSPNGQIKVGKPNFAQPPRGTLFLNKDSRNSNVLSMKVTRESTKIPNVILPIWTGRENTIQRVTLGEPFYNNRVEPTRLRKLNHLLQKTIVVSTPDGSAPQELSDINRFYVGNGTLFQSYAKSELARANMYETIVQVLVPGHYNNLGEPFIQDTVYKIEFDRGNVNDNMYLYQVSYSGSDAEGQKTVLSFCPLHTIVADTRAK